MVISPLLASSSPVLSAVDRRRGQGGAPASAARTNDLDAGEDPPRADATGRRGEKCCDSSHEAPPVMPRRSSRGACGAQPYLGPRTTSGDMMIDGVPDVRAADRGAATQSFREVHPTAGWRQGTCGSRPRASAEVWTGHARNAWLGGHLP